MPTTGSGSSGSRGRRRRSMTRTSSRCMRPARRAGCCSSRCGTCPAATCARLSGARARCRRAGRPDHVYLSDFGLSKPALAVTGLTRTGQFLGTLDYVAPEQLGGQPVDGRTDQYALACAAFELLTGSPPFHREDAMAVMYGHISQPPPPLTSQRPDLPAAADQVLARALAKAPAERYATCCDFADALRGSLGLPPYAQVPGEVAAQSGQAGRPASTRTVIWSGQDAGDAAAPGDAVVPGDAAAPGEDAAPGKAVQDEEGEEAGAAGRG